MKTHLKIHIQGQVQKVGFRWNTKIQAQKLRIKGFITNNRDGSVYIEAEANTDKLEKFVNWCQTGPKFAQVKNIDIKKGKIKNFKVFKIIT